LKAPLISAFALVAAVATGAYGTALALVGSQVSILPLKLFTMVVGCRLRFRGHRNAWA
jgi:ABC-type uncharacterized transport system permease subunit